MIHKRVINPDIKLNHWIADWIRKDVAERTSEFFFMLVHNHNNSLLLLFSMCSWLLITLAIPLKVYCIWFIKLFKNVFSFGFNVFVLLWLIMFRVEFCNEFLLIRDVWFMLCYSVFHITGSPTNQWIAIQLWHSILSKHICLGVHVSFAIALLFINYHSTDWWFSIEQSHEKWQKKYNYIITLNGSIISLFKKLDFNQIYSEF